MRLPACSQRCIQAKRTTVMLTIGKNSDDTVEGDTEEEKEWGNRT
jgi:hypothetical protein